MGKIGGGFGNYFSDDRTIKMDTKVLKIALGLTALYYAVLRGANAVLAGIKGYDLVGVSVADKTIKIRLNFWIKNPLFVGLRLKGVYGKVFIQGVECGEVNSTYNYYIAGRQAYNVPVTVSLSMSGLAEATIRNIETGNINTLTISFDGSVGVGSDHVVSIPVQKTVTYNELVS